jgi:hypothetical protein
MIARALDSNNDLMVENGSLRLVEEAAETVQHVRSRLLFYLEEWFLDLGAGTPWFQQILKKPVNLANVEAIIKNRILNTAGVQRLTAFTMDYEGASIRTLSVAFSAETVYGSIDSEKVTINV